MILNEISVHDYQTRRDAGEAIVLLDVRDDDELVTASVAGAMHIPMSEIPNRINELPHDRPIAVMCHHGGRSARVTGFLNANGFENAVNLDGGIDAYATEIDTTVARY